MTQKNKSREHNSYLLMVTIKQSKEAGLSTSCSLYSSES